MSIFPHDDGPKVAVVGIGAPGRDVRQTVAATWEDEFGVPVTDLGSVAVPESVADGEEPLFSSAFVETAHETAGEDHDLVVGVTDRDIRAGSYDFVFGVWNGVDGVGVLSTARLTEGDPTEAQAQERLRTVVLNGAGALFEIHPHDDCVMELTRSVEDDERSVERLDRIPAAFCEDCERQLRGENTAPRPPKWHVLTAERRGMRRATRWAEGDVRLKEYPFYLLVEIVGRLYALRWRLSGVSSPGLPRCLRAFVHESYRIGRFWWKVLSFFAAYILVVGGVFSVFDMDTTSVSPVGWGVLAVGLPLAWLVSEIVNGILYGVASGLRRGVREGLRAEE